MSNCLSHLFISFYGDNFYNTESSSVNMLQRHNTDITYSHIEHIRLSNKCIKEILQNAFNSCIQDYFINTMNKKLINYLYFLIKFKKLRNLCQNIKSYFNFCVAQLNNTYNFINSKCVFILFYKMHLFFIHYKYIKSLKRRLVINLKY